jgi:hypothetical protein
VSGAPTITRVDMIWATAIGIAVLAAGLIAPFFHRWRFRRHARKLEARQHRGYDRYHEELRDLEAYPPQGIMAFNWKVALGAIAAALLVATYTVAFRHDDAGWFRGLDPLLKGGAGLIGGIAVLYRWRKDHLEAQRHVAISSPTEARDWFHGEQGQKRLGQVGLMLLSILLLAQGIMEIKAEWL